MENDRMIQEHVAQRIKMYRKRRHMTVGTLATLLHVSPSTVSKYENARLSVSIQTLFEIADILGVEVNQLIDYQKERPNKEVEVDESNFFKRGNKFYLYQYFAPEKRIHASVMEVIPGDTPEKDNVILYYSTDEKNYTDAEYIYRGTISHHSLITNIHCYNPYNLTDDLSFCVRMPFSLRTETEGMMLAVSQSLRAPYAVKVIFSLNPLQMDDDLKERLLVTDKNTFTAMKKVNAFVLY